MHRDVSSGFAGTSRRAPRRLANLDDPLISTARAEDGGADAHIGRAELNGAREIAAHPHAQLLDAEPRGDLGEKREMHRRLLVEGWNAHQPFDDEIEILPTERDEFVDLGRQHAGFLRLLASIDLHEEARAIPRSRHFLGESTGKL